MLERIYFETDNVVERNSYSPSVFRRHMQRYISAALELQRYKPMYCVILDVACGSGYGAIPLGSLCQRYLGLDRDETAVLYARKHYGDESCAFEQADIMDVTFPRCDAIVSVETYEHLQEEGQRFFLLKCVESLTRDGCLYLTTVLGKGQSETNPYHLHEPNYEELLHALQVEFFYVKPIHSEKILSTSGDEKQFVSMFCTHPREAQYKSFVETFRQNSLSG